MSAATSSRAALASTCGGGGGVERRRRDRAARHAVGLCCLSRCLQATTKGGGVVLGSLFEDGVLAVLLPAFGLVFFSTECCLAERSALAVRRFGRSPVRLGKSVKAGCCWLPRVKCIPGIRDAGPAVGGERRDLEREGEAARPASGAASQASHRWLVVSLAKPFGTNRIKERRVCCCKSPTG